MRIGVYPGTFDPVTLGHMDIIRRGAKLVDRLVVGVTTNPGKSPMFTLAERMAAVEREVAAIGGDIRKFVSPAVRDEVVARVTRDGRRGG